MFFSDAPWQAIQAIHAMRLPHCGHQHATKAEPENGLEKLTACFFHLYHSGPASSMAMTRAADHEFTGRSLEHRCPQHSPLLIILRFPPTAGTTS
jgi:hypothetical protein